MVSFTAYPSMEDVAEQIRGEDAEDVFDFIEHLSRGASRGDAGSLGDLFTYIEDWRPDDKRKADVKAFAELLLKATAWP